VKTFISGFTIASSRRAFFRAQRFPIHRPKHIHTVATDQSGAAAEATAGGAR
jgi:hypothetical protein